MSKVRFGIFTDLHANYTPDAMSRLMEYIQTMNEGQVDFNMQLGDFCPLPEDHSTYMKALEQLEAPVYHVLGNHDADFYDYVTTLSKYNLHKDHYYFDHGEYRFVVMNTNYYHDDDQSTYSPFENGATGKPNLSAEQMDWFEKLAMEDNDKRLILFTHTSVMEPAMGIGNKELFLPILDRINEAFNYTKIIAAFNGHYHFESAYERHGTHYVIIPSISGQWLSTSCINTDIPEELTLKYPELKHFVPYTKSIYTIVEIEDGNIHIKGCDSTYETGLPSKYGQKMTIGEGNLTPNLSEYNLKF